VQGRIPREPSDVYKPARARPHHGAQRMKQPAPDLHAVHHRVLQYLHPEQVEVERGRTEALEVRHGCSAERDERWSAVRSPAHPRW
jgi:hypothetical protein